MGIVGGLRGPIGGVSPLFAGVKTMVFAGLIGGVSPLFAGLVCPPGQPSKPYVLTRVRLPRPFLPLFSPLFAALFAGPKNAVFAGA